MIWKKPPTIAMTDAMAAMYPVPVRIAVVTAVRPPKVLPMKEMNPPVEGSTLVNSERVLPRKSRATPAAMMVSGEASPAV